MKNTFTQLEDGTRENIIYILRDPFYLFEKLLLRIHFVVNEIKFPRSTDSYKRTFLVMRSRLLVYFRTFSIDDENRRISKTERIDIPTWANFFSFWSTRFTLNPPNLSKSRPRQRGADKADKLGTESLTLWRNILRELERHIGGGKLNWRNLKEQQKFSNSSMVPLVGYADTWWLPEYRVRRDVIYPVAGHERWPLLTWPSSSLTRAIERSLTNCWILR